jgi:hypothetical protein
MHNKITRILLLAVIIAGTTLVVIFRETIDATALAAWVKDAGAVGHGGISTAFDPPSAAEPMVSFQELKRYLGAVEGLLQLDIRSGARRYGIPITFKSNHNGDAL